jgi:hypothetical protein
MTNAQYLVVSYFAVGALSFGVAVAAYLLFRRSLTSVADAVPSKGLGAALKRLFPIGIAFATLFGFLSVSFKSCDRNTYEKVIADRSYLVGKNYEEISTALLYAVIALVVWGLILVIPLVVIRRSRAERK